MKSTALIFLISILSLHSYSQMGTIKGRVYNGINNEPLPYVNVVIENTSIGSTTDENGDYKIEQLTPGTYNLTCSSLGFEKAIRLEVEVGSSKSVNIDFAMKEMAMALDEVEIVASPFTQKEESPLSMRTINATEIYRNPGGNRDISKVIQSLPGVASTISFRNDIIVRGGAPNENRFYLDGIEVPNINHFATQGSSGGPVGLINVNFIKEVEFYSSAFPANRGNALSSVMDFTQIEGNDEKLRGTFMLGSSDAGLTIDGPLGKKSNFILSARRSYLQFLFQGLGLPFLPTYNDFQFKNTFKINQRNQISLVGLGAIDDFSLNEGVNDGLTDPDEIERNDYILNNLPVNTQWNYTVGGSWKHFFDKSFTTLVVSRNHLNNQAIKFKDNIEEPANKLLDYSSVEIENKFRFEHTIRSNGWKMNYGVAFEDVTYTNETYSQLIINGQPATIEFDSELDFQKYAGFVQMSKGLFKNRLTVSAGLRTDGNNYSAQMSNLIDQLSPRGSVSFSVTEKLSLNTSVGRYFQLPPLTVLGYRDAEGLLVNKSNQLKYIQADHLVAGVELKPSLYSKITVEGFYKAYSKYPFLINDGISLANLGGDFGVIGNEPVTSTSNGRSYGLEVLAQQRLSSSVYGILSYTFVRSEFEDKNGELLPAAWDNVHILNITAGKKFKKNWELGAKFRLQGGSPYTPYDVRLSAQRAVWDIRQQGILDWDNVNGERFPLVHALDVRLDKKWYFQKWSLNVYGDVQNVYNFQAEVQSYLNVQTNDAGDPLISATDPNAYELKTLRNFAGTFLPSIGLMVEF
ncbi:MAG: TonB-dependent receptor [Flavobacteriales bacterium]|nr:TonB-dependent receptor [Flavobacteriales bacterium]MBT7687652.1 TonB-dependent receptor [Flavobacteriales bacterium]MBT7749451.1 TonB-dependent receptor [Flavobacteriales bacterium]